MASRNDPSTWTVEELRAALQEAGAEPSSVWKSAPREELVAMVGGRCALPAGGCA